jgi:ribosomal protein S27AE
MDETEVRVVRLCPKCGPTTNYDGNLKCGVCGENTKEEVIVGSDLGGFAPPPPPPSYMETQFSTRATGKRMCIEYGKEIPADARFCPHHGIAIPDSRVSEQSMTALAAIGGIFGFHGLGHITLGNMGLGFLALFAGWVLLAGILMSYFLGWLMYGETAYISLMVILGVAYLLLFIWGVMSTNELARKRNLDYENHKAA